MEIKTLAQWRKLRMMTVRQLAEATDLSKTTINLIETGQRSPQFDTIKQLASALEVRPEQIQEARPALGLEDKG